MAIATRRASIVRPRVVYPITLQNIQQAVVALPTSEQLAATAPKSGAIQQANRLRREIADVFESHFENPQDFVEANAQFTQAVTQRPDLLVEVLRPWLTAVLSSSAGTVIIIKRRSEGYAENTILDYIGANQKNLVDFEEILDDYLTDTLWPADNNISDAELAILDQNLTQIIKYLYNLNALAMEIVLLQLRRRLLTLPRSLPLLQQWLAQVLWRPTVRGQVIPRLRSSLRDCIAMSKPESKVCRNPDGNLVGDTWCEIPPWAYYIDVDGYCYDSRELLQRVAIQVSSDDQTPAAQPSFPFTRAPISPTLLRQWVAASQRNAHPIPLAILRSLQVYDKLGDDTVSPLSHWHSRSAAFWSYRRDSAKLSAEI